MKERTAGREPFPPSLFLPDPHYHGRASFPSLCFAFSPSFVSTPLCLSHLYPPTFTPSSVSNSLPLPPCLLGLASLTSLPQHSGPSLGGCHGPAECWTPSEVFLWSSTPFPFLFGAFSGDLDEGRDLGRGRQPWSLGSKCFFLWYWRRDSGQSRWELHRRKERQRTFTT